MEISMFLATIPFKKLRRRNMETYDQICLKISTFYFLWEKYTENIDIFDSLLQV